MVRNIKNKQENDSFARESIGDMEQNGRFALIYDPDYFTIDFVRETRDKVRWIFNFGPYDKKLRREFNMDDDPYGFLR